MSIESLFGPGTPLAVRFVIAFLVVLALIGLLVMVLRRFGPNAIRGTAGRRAAVRLGVLEVYPLDPQRKLVIVRRDGVEHLIMIGGPNDVVIETNIVRATPATQPAKTAPAPAQVPASTVPPAPPTSPSATADPAPAAPTAQRVQTLLTAAVPVPPALAPEGRPVPAGPAPAAGPPKTPTDAAFEAILDRVRGAPKP